MRHAEPEAYGRLCSEYYDLDKPRAQAQTLNFYMGKAAAAEGAILEPMCGTGSFLLPMMDAGYDVCGFDASKWMISILNHRAKKSGLRPRVWQGFISDLRIAARYGLIFIPNGSFNLLVEPGEPQKALKILRKHMLTGGRLVFDLETEAIREPGLVVEPWVGEVSRPNGGKTIRLTTLAVDGEPDVETSLCQYDVMSGQHVEESESETFRIRYFDRQTITAWLTEAGFGGIVFWKPHSNEPAPTGFGPMVSVEAVAMDAG